MGGAIGTNGEEKFIQGFFLGGGELREQNLVEDLSLDGR